MATPILPGRTIGIVGGGQLGRMFALAARRMGYRINVFDPVAHGPAGQLADAEVCADYHDVDAARRFARDVDVVTFEFENIPAETLSCTPPVTITRRVRDGETVVLDLAAARLPFGHGHRACPGREHALALAAGVLDAAARQEPALTNPASGAL